MKIESGITRNCLVFKNIVIKFPTFISYKLFLKGLLANLQEKQFSKLEREDLAKVYYGNSLGLVIIMKRANVVDVLCNWGEFKDMIYKKYENDNMKDFMLSDCKPSNWGYINNNLVKIDYGD